MRREVLVSKSVCECFNMSLSGKYAILIWFVALFYLGID